METVDITCKLQKIGMLDNEVSLKGFVINVNNNTYIVTTHHGLPIDECYLDNDSNNKLSIYINSIWNELLILKSEYKIDNVRINKRHKIKIPNNTDTLYIKNDKVNIRLTNVTITFMCLHYLPTNPQQIYIKADNIITDDVLQSYSGSPVFNESNSLIGILSKKNTSDNSVYIIPIYILLKTLLKEDNESIYDIIYDKDITKINSISLRENKYLHKKMGVYMNLTTYFLIEGDKDKEELINNDVVMYTNINKYLYISNDKNLIMNVNKYELTIRFYKLIQICYSEIARELYDIIKNYHKNKIYIYVNKKKSKNINSDIEIINTRINLKFKVISDEVSLR